MPTLHFDPEKEIPDLSGKVILITGGTSGLGSESILSLAAHGPSHIFFTGRSQSGASSVQAKLSEQHPGVANTFVRCDLTSLPSVVSAAETILAHPATTTLDLVMCNAGIMAVPPAQTEQGYEVQFGVCHVAHALLLKLLTPRLQRTATAAVSTPRVVWLTSLGHRAHPSAGIEFATLRTAQASISPVLAPWVRYGQAKLANLLYARAYARRHPDLVSVAVHPGVSWTGLIDGLDWANKAFVWTTTLTARLPTDQCAWNQQWAATAPLGRGEREVESGVYYEPVGVRGALKRKAGDERLEKELWEWTEKELEGYNL